MADKILIWGTGLVARGCLSRGVRGEIIGFIESEPKTDTITYKDRAYPIYRPSDIPEDYDVIIVAVKSCADEIYESCKKHNIDLKRTIFLFKSENMEWHCSLVYALKILGLKNYNLLLEWLRSNYKRSFYGSVDYWYGPRAILDKLDDTEGLKKCGMSEKDHGFICGLLKKYRPSKILEVGVAEGGTTAVIMNALKLLDLESEVTSIDLSEEVYYNPAHRTGCFIDKLKNEFAGKSAHKLILGSTVADNIEDIGPGIDFVILDTTHCLPGEILEFLCLLPYLSMNAVVVLHDISLNSNRMYTYAPNAVELMRNSSSEICTLTLFSVVSAEKYIDLDYYPNNSAAPFIAAIQTNDDTYKNAADCFMALNMTWSYIPDQKTIEKYQKIFMKYYDDNCNRIFSIAYQSNIKMEQKRERAAELDKALNNRSAIIEYLKSKGMNNIAIYGMDNFGKIFSDMFAPDINVLIGIDRDESLDEYKGIKIYHDYKNIPECDGVVFAAKCGERLIAEVSEKHKCVSLPDLIAGL